MTEEALSTHKERPGLSGVSGIYRPRDPI